MAFTQTEENDVRNLMHSFIEDLRPPEHIRPQLDLGYRIENQDVFLFEIRPKWDKPEKIMSPESIRPELAKMNLASQ